MQAESSARALAASRNFIARRAVVIVIGKPPVAFLYAPAAGLPAVAFFGWGESASDNCAA